MFVDTILLDMESQGCLLHTLTFVSQQLSVRSQILIGHYETPITFGADKRKWLEKNSTDTKVSIATML